MDKIVFVLVFLFASATSQADIPANMPQSIYDQIIQQVIQDKGYLDMSAVQESIAQWQLQQPLPPTDGTLIETGNCTTCSANTQGTSAQFKKPRNVRVKARRHANGKYPSVLKIRWLKPKRLKPSLRSQYKVSHYLIYISKDGQSYEVLKKKAKYFKSGKLKRIQRIKFKDRTTGSYAVQVQAVYKLKTATAKSGKKSKNKGASSDSLSPWSPSNTFQTQSKYTRVGQYIGSSLHSCLNNNGFTDATLLTAVDPSIDCTGYNLQNADIDLMANLTNIRSIIITDNPAVTDISALANLNYLEYLDLSNNPNLILPDFSLFSELTTLKLANMGLTTVPDLTTNDLLTTLDLNNNAITSGFDLLPSALTVLDTKSTSVNPCDTIPPEKTIDSLTLSGANITSIESCGNVTGLRYLAVGDAPNLEVVATSSKVSVSINNFAGFCGLTFYNTNIEILEGSRPINRLNLIDNNNLQQVTAIKPAYNNANTQYPDLIPASIRIQGSDSMDCSVMYQKKTLIETLPSLKMKGVQVTTNINGNIKNSLECPLTKPVDYQIFPTQCKPDALASLDVYTSANSRFITWTTDPTFDYAQWGVTYFQLQGFKGDSITPRFTRNISINNSTPVFTDDIKSTKYTIKACTNNQCGNVIETTSNDFKPGINTPSVTANYQVGSNQIFDLSIIYDTKPSTNDIAKPTRFEVSSYMNPGFSQVYDCAGICSNGPFIISNISNEGLGSELQVKACNDSLGCGPSLSVDVRYIVTSSDLPVPIWVSVQSRGLGTIPLKWKFQSDVSTTQLNNVDYIEIVEWKPQAKEATGQKKLYDQWGNVIDSYAFGSRTKEITYVEHDKSLEPNVVRQEMLKRVVAGYYDFDMRACKRDRVNGDICSGYINGIKTVQSIDGGGNLITKNCSNYVQKNDICTNSGYSSGGVTYDYKLEYISDPASSGSYIIPSNVTNLNWVVDNSSGKYTISWDFNNGDYTITNPEPSYFYVQQIGCITENCKSYKITNADRVQTNDGIKWTPKIFVDDMYMNTQWQVTACINGKTCSDSDTQASTNAPTITIGTGTPGTTLPNINSTNTNAPTATGGPGDFLPGMWWNKDVAGTGWHFYWASDLRYPSSSNNPHQVYGNTYDLVGYWFAFKQDTSRGVWTPTWFEVRLKNIGKPFEPTPTDPVYPGVSGCFEGAIISNKKDPSGDVVKNNVGNLQVCFTTSAPQGVSANQTAILIFDISDGNGILTQKSNVINLGPYESLADGRLRLHIEDFAIDIIGTNQGSISSPNNDDHYSGLWQNNDESVSMLTWLEKGLEVSTLALYDADGDPIWFNAVNCSSTNSCVSSGVGYFDNYVTGQAPDDTSGLSLYGIEKGFNPLGKTPSTYTYQGVFAPGVVYTYGRMGRCINPNASQTGNASRFKEAKLWYNVSKDLYSGDGLIANRKVNPLDPFGSNCATSDIVLNKKASLHDIRFFINGNDESVTSCDPNDIDNNYRCNLTFTWYTDDDFPSIEAYYSLGGGYQPLSTICTGAPDGDNYVVKDFECDFTTKVEGSYTFQLRKKNYGSTLKDIVIAQSEPFALAGCISSACMPTILDQISASPVAIDPEVSNQVGAGPIPGSGGVSGGSATYNLPLVVPPGRNGMTPSLSVNYSSKGGNGILGVGWSLSVGSSIYRCPQTLAQDGAIKPVTLSNDDRLCLDGQRLMKISGTDYFTTGAQYRTEQDSFAKIVKTSTGFTVYTKSGRINTYVQQGNQKTTWQLTKEEDSFGNKITYLYNIYDNVIKTFGINEILLTEIYYTGNTTQIGDRKIRLNYVNRSDENSSYLAGQRTDVTQVLDNIQTYTNYNSGSGLAVRNYQFSIVSSKVTNRSLLSNVVEKIGGINSTTQRELLNNSWSQNQAGSGWEQKTDSNGNTFYSPSHKLIRLGLEELGVIQEDYWNVYQTDSFVYMNGVTKLRPVSDLNGDGLKEFLVNYRRYNHESESYTAGGQLVDFNSEGIIEKNYNVPYSTNHTVDFDLDGRPDVYSFKETAQGAYQLQITKWDNTKVSSTNNLSDQFVIINTGLTLPSTIKPYGAQFYDYDQDGDFDLFLTDLNDEQESYCPAGTDSSTKCRKINLYTNNYSSISTGASTSVGIDFTTSIPQEVATIETIYNTSNIPLYYQMFKGVEDINNDGVPEIRIDATATVGAGAGNVVVFYKAISSPSTDYYFDTEIQITDFGISNLYAYHQWIDVNQDGLNDLIIIDTVNGTKVWAVKLNKGGELINSAGDVQNIFTSPYKSSSNAYLHPETSPATPLYEYGFPVESGAPCAECSDSPRRANSIKLIDINSDGKNELIIANPDDMYWNFCRSYAAYCSGCTGPALNTLAQSCTDSGSTNVDQINLALPATTFQTCLLENDINNNIYPRQLPLNTPNQVSGGITEVLFYCANPSGGASNLYEPNSQPPAMADAVPYLGNSDRSIYSFDSIEFDLDLSGGVTSLQVTVRPTSMVGDISKTGQIDIDNDGISELYSKLGCEFTGCMVAHQTGSYPNIFDANGDILPDSIFKQYLVDYFSTDGTVNTVNKEAFFADIDESRSMIINKSTAVMPDMLVKVEKPTLSTMVEWEYHPLNTKAEALPNRIDFPLYQVKERNCTQTQQASTPEQCNSYVDEDALAGDHFYFNSSMYVVSEMRQTNNYGHNSLTEYAYEEAVYNNKGRGFQGFRKISVRTNPDEQSGSIAFETLSESTFHQVFPYAGKLEKIQSWQYDNSNPRNLRKTQEEKYTYAQTNQSNNSANRVVYYPLINKVSQNFELNNGNTVSKSTTTIPTASYDDYGNITNQTTTLKSYLPNNKTRQETTVTTNVYDTADISNWWVDKLSKTTVQKSVTDDRLGSPAFVSHTTHSKFFWQTGSKRELDCQYTYIGADPTSCTDAIVDEDSSRNSFNYDTNGNITSVTTTAYDAIYASAQSRTVTTAYTTDGYFPSRITKAGLITTFDDYDQATGQVKQSTSPQGIITTNSYDAFGFQIQQSNAFAIGAVGNKIPTSYTTIRNCGTVTIPQDPCDGMQLLVHSIKESNSYGDMIEGTPQLKYYTEQRQNGQPHLVTFYDSANNPVITKTTHSDEQTNYTVTITSPIGVAEISTQPFANTSGAYPTINIPDAQGRIIEKVTKAALNGNSGTCTLTTTYNHNGALTSIIAANTNVAQTLVNMTCSTTDIQSNLSMSRQYDATGKLLSTTDADTNTVTYWYDASGNPLILQDADDNKIITNFDALGRKQSVDDPNMGFKTFAYNGFGEVIQQTDAENNHVFYKYDSNGRLIEQQSNFNAYVPDFINNSESVILGNNKRTYYDDYIYDSSTGLLTQAQRYSNRINPTLMQLSYNKAIVYDGQNRPIEEITTLYDILVTTGNVATNTQNIPTSYTTSYRYDANYNRLLQTTYNDRYSVANIYTKYGSLKEQLEKVNGTSPLMQVTAWNNRGQETMRIFNGNSNMYSQTS